MLLKRFSFNLSSFVFSPVTKQLFLLPHQVMTHSFDLIVGRIN